MSSVVSWEQTSNLMCQMHWSVTMGNYIPGCHTAVSAVWAFSAVHVGTLNYSSSNELGTFDSIQTFTEASQEFSHQSDIQRNWALNLYCTLSGFQNYEFARRVCGHIQVVARVFSDKFLDTTDQINPLYPHASTAFLAYFNHEPEHEIPFRTSCFCIWCFFYLPHL